MSLSFIQQSLKCNPTWKMMSVCVFKLFIDILIREEIYLKFLKRD